MASIMRVIDIEYSDGRWRFSVLRINNIYMTHARTISFAISSIILLQPMFVIPNLAMCCSTIMLEQSLLLLSLEGSGQWTIYYYCVS